MKSRSAIMSISAAMAMGLLTRIHDEDGVVTIEPTRDAKAENNVLIIGPEPATEPRRHAGKREAARRLRQLVKRSTTTAAE